MAGKELTCMQLSHLRARCAGKLSAAEQSSCTLCPQGTGHTWVPAMNALVKVEKNKKVLVVWDIEMCESNHGLQVNID